MALVPSELPDIPLRIARAYLEEVGLRISSGPASDWHIEGPGDTYLIFFPPSSGTLSSMSFEGICAKFKINCTDAVIAVYQMMGKESGGEEAGRSATA